MFQNLHPVGYRLAVGFFNRWEVRCGYFDLGFFVMSSSLIMFVPWPSILFPGPSDFSGVLIDNAVLYTLSSLEWWTQGFDLPIGLVNRFDLGNQLLTSACVLVKQTGRQTEPGLLCSQRGAAFKLKHFNYKVAAPMPFVTSTWYLLNFNTTQQLLSRSMTDVVCHLLPKPNNIQTVVCFSASQKMTKQVQWQQSNQRCK